MGYQYGTVPKEDGIRTTDSPDTDRQLILLVLMVVGVAAAVMVMG